MELDVRSSIQNWIRDSLGRDQAFLGNMPPCPFASEALLKRQIFIETATKENIFSKVTGALENFFAGGYKIHVIAIQEGAEVDMATADAFVLECREKFFSNDLWLLYDHPSYKETVHNVSFNHGTYLLFMVQRLSDLVEASSKLKKTSYYDQWPAGYYQEVVGIRNEYYRKYLQLNTQKNARE